MKYKITRRQVLKALRTEPLKAGNWVHFSGLKDLPEGAAYYDDRKLREYRKPATAKCKVCAVGAVLRGSLGDKITLGQIQDFGDNDMIGACMVGDTPYASSDAYSIKEAKEVAEEVLKRYKNPLIGLSNYFETLYYNIYDLESATPRQIGSKMKAIRLELAKFVKKNFPKSIRVDI